MRCAAYCTAVIFNTTGLFGYLKKTYTPLRFREVLHIKYAQTDPASKEGDVFIFPYGSVVFWGLRDDQERRFLNEIRQFEQHSLDTIEDDIFSYEYGEQGKIEDDEITLPDHEILTKLAFSYGLGQSVKLGVLEQTIQKTIHLTRELPEYLAKEGKIRLSRKEIRRMIGQLFIDRSSINLHMDLLETPEFFWEHADLELLYNLTANYLEKERRVNVVNQRLLIMQELLDMLGSELNHQHSAQLEWTIILLIVSEVAITLAQTFNLL